MELTVYLAGEIHSNWRDEILEGAEMEGLPIEFLSPVTDHDASDNPRDQSRKQRRSRSESDSEAQR